MKVKQEIFSDKELKPGDFLNKGNNEDEDTSDKIVILKHKKASNESLRKSLRIQNRTGGEKKLQQLQDQKGKKLAAKFVFTKSLVTYWPPVGYYGQFGVAEKYVKAATESPDIIEIDEEEDDLIIDDVSN